MTAALLTRKSGGPNFSSVAAAQAETAAASETSTV